MRSWATMSRNASATRPTLPTQTDPVYKDAITGKWHWLLPGTVYFAGPFETQQLAHRDLKEFTDDEEE